MLSILFSFFAGLFSLFSFHSTIQANDMATSTIQATATTTETAMLTPTSSVSISTEAPTLTKKIMNIIKPSIQTSTKKAPEIVNPSGFINTNDQPITIGQFKGKKVVLVSFWTYTCINCKRTLPYLNDWYSKYKDQGLEIVSIHTPEFGFEADKANVENAVKEQKIEYPVVQDNDYSTWNAFGNRYWPHKYLINENGEIIYDHIGEGDYDETEKQIQTALAELNSK